MDLARDVCSAVLSLREIHRRRIRLPLPLLTVVHQNAESLRDYTLLIAEAINVKDVLLTADLDRFGTREIKVNPRIGAKIGPKMKGVMAAQKAASFTLRDDGCADIGGVTLDPEDFELRFCTPEGTAAQPIDGWRGLVILNTSIDAALQAEGWARDFIRLVQQSRKQAGFAVTDRIQLRAKLEGAFAEAIAVHRETICAATLANSFELVEEPAGHFIASEKLDEHELRIAITRDAGPAKSGGDSSFER
jgi:isoleucyl-tRNA synthetase